MDRQQAQIFTRADGQAQFAVALDMGTAWLTQEQLCQLLGRERSVITKHIRNVFRMGSWSRIQYVQNLHILLPTTKTIGRSLKSRI